MILEDFIYKKILLTEANDAQTILNSAEDGTDKMFIQSIRKYLEQGFVDIRFEKEIVNFSINPEFAKSIKERYQKLLGSSKIEDITLSQFRMHLVLLLKTFLTVSQTQKKVNARNIHNYVVAALLRNKNGIRKVTAKQTGVFAFNLDLPIGN